MVETPEEKAQCKGINVLNLLPSAVMTDCRDSLMIKSCCVKYNVKFTF